MDNLSVYWESIPTGRENDVATSSAKRNCISIFIKCVTMQFCLKILTNRHYSDIICNSERDMSQMSRLRKTAYPLTKPFVVGADSTYGKWLLHKRREKWQTKIEILRAYGYPKKYGLTSG